MNEDLNLLLVGRWTIDPKDVESLQAYGQTTLVFGADGSLRYIVHGEKKDQVMLLRYRVENGVLITDQPSEPREERTRFILTPDGELLLQYGKVQSRYVRNDKSDRSAIS